MIGTLESQVARPVHAFRSEEQVPTGSLYVINVMIRRVQSGKETIRACVFHLATDMSHMTEHSDRNVRLALESSWLDMRKNTCL